MCYRFCWFCKMFFFLIGCICWWYCIFCLLFLCGGFGEKVVVGIFVKMVWEYCLCLSKWGVCLCWKVGVFYCINCGWLISWFFLLVYCWFVWFGWEVWVLLRFFFFVWFGIFLFCCVRIGSRWKWRWCLWGWVLLVRSRLWFCYVFLFLWFEVIFVIDLCVYVLFVEWFIEFVV